MVTNICSLPPDCLKLVLSKVDYGSDMRLLWALSGSCKTVKQALKDCPADLELQGEWGAEQLLGLCSKLPNMASLSFSSSFETKDGNGGNCPGDIIIRFGLFLASSNLRHLDLRYADKVISKVYFEPMEWPLLGRRPPLPKGLLNLYLPGQRGQISKQNSSYVIERIRGSQLFEELVEGINNLGHLTCLECGSARLGKLDFWPSSNLTSLQDLTVSGGSYVQSCQDDAAAFLATTLERLTNLTRLHVYHADRLKRLEIPVAIQELRITALWVEQTPFKFSLSWVQALTSLELRLSNPNTGPAQADLSGMAFDHLRRLVLFEISCPPIGLTAPSLKELRLHGPTKRLGSGVIAWISALASVRRLELYGWSYWDNGWEDVTPLASMPLLTELVLDQGLGFLADLLQLGCLQNLQSVSLMANSRTAWLPVKQSTVFSVAKGLVALPRFRLLSCSPGSPRPHRILGLLPYALEKKYGKNFKKAQLELALEAVVEFHSNKWRCLLSKGSHRIYEKKDLR